MTITQVFTHRWGDFYDDEITITEIPKGYFPAIVSNKAPAPDADTREVRIDLMALEQSPGGNMTTNTNKIEKRENEKAIRVKVFQDEVELAENIQNYS